MSRKKYFLLLPIAAAFLISSCSSETPEIIVHDIGSLADQAGYIIPEIAEEKITGVIIDEPDPAASIPEPAEHVIMSFSGRDVSDMIYDSEQHTTSGNYSYEYQETDGRITILGPNLVYVGESFTYDFICYSDIEPYFVWSVDGDCGNISEDGTFTALKEGVCGLTVTDRTDGSHTVLKVHCIKNAKDVDFIPMVNNIPVANKTYPLPPDYDPGFSPEAEEAMNEMMAGAEADGINLFTISTYRSYDYQVNLFQHWVDVYGSSADLVSARPGFSEHQLGLAADLNQLEYSFADTAEGKWIKEHCAEYGFILRYPTFESQKYTGYNFEPWHLRYLGKELARKVTDTGLTLEEILGIDSRYR